MENDPFARAALACTDHLASVETGASPCSPPALAAALAAPARLAHLRDLGVLDTPREAAFDRVARLAARTLGVPIALLSLITDECQFFKGSIGLGEPWASRCGAPFSHSLCQHVVGANAPLIIANAPADPRWRDHPAVVEFGVVAYLGVPLATADGLVLGSLCAIDTAPRAWDAAALDSLRDLAAMVMSEFALRAAARELAQERTELRAQRDRARTIMESVSQGLIIGDEAGSFVYANRSFAEMVGLEQAALRGQPIATVVAPEATRSLDAALSRTRSMASAAATITDLRLLHADGEAIDAQIASVALPTEGGRREILATVSDQTESRAIEAELRRERDFTAAVLETAGSLVLVLDRAGRLLRFNRACEILTGRSFALVVGRSLDQVIAAEEAAPFIATWDLLRAGVPPVSFEHRWRGANGEAHDIDWTITALLDGRGQPNYVVGVGVDITERKRVERQRAAEHAVASVLAEAVSLREAAPIFLEAICAHLDLVVGELWLPDATAAALERTARWSLASDPDLALAARTAALTFSPGVGLPGEVWSSGVPVWWRPVTELTATLRPALTAAGVAGAFACPIVSEQTTLGALVFLSDEPRPPDEELQATLLAIGQQFGRFLEHRRAEAALHTTHQRLDFHVQNAPLSVVEWGPDLRIHRWSAEAEHLFGWSAEEIVGRLVGDWPFIHVDDEALVAPIISDLLAGRADRNLQRNRNYTKAGGVVHVEWHNSVLRDPDGALVSVMSLGLDITERVRLQERLAHQALHDPLTGLPNRALLLERLEQEVARATRRGTSVAVLFLDLDGFKAANDRLGHAAGDEVLITVAARLRAHLRGDDTVARLGGDEFVVILAAPTAPQEAIAVAERLRAAIAQPLTLAAGEATVGTSIGIALSTPDCANSEALLAAADAAMYRAKGAKGRYALATA